LEVSRAASKTKKADDVLDLLRLHPKQPWPKNAINARDVQRARIAVSSDEAVALLGQMEDEGRLVGKDYRPATGGHVVRYYRKALRQP
jgi:hypothetical protein